MTITFIELYNDCAGQPWSMYDGDAESKDDLESALKISINKALSYLWNYQPWSFRIKTSTVVTKNGRNNYNTPNGILTKRTISGEIRYGIWYDGNRLSYVTDYEALDDNTGEPESFYIRGEYIYLYPVPDAVYRITLEYLTLPCASTEDGESIYELSEDTDYINIPDKYEKLFRNCLISLAMMYAIADESDENYSGYKKQYEDSLAILIKYCKNGLVDRSIVW